MHINHYKYELQTQTKCTKMVIKFILQTQIKMHINVNKDSYVK